MKNNCLVTFSGDFESACHLHHDIGTEYGVHGSDATCVICKESMGPFLPITSIALSCCNSGWCHRRCLKNSAYSSAQQLSCPSCGNNEQFIQHMLSFGINITKPLYTNEHDIDINNNSNFLTTKRRQTRKMWVFDHTFNFKDEALEYLKNEGHWSYHYRNKSDEGVKLSLQSR